MASLFRDEPALTMKAPHMPRGEPSFVHVHEVRIHEGSLIQVSQSLGRIGRLKRGHDFRQHTTMWIRKAGSSTAIGGNKQREPRRPGKE